MGAKNPLFHRLVQTYLVAGKAAEDLVKDPWTSCYRTVQLLGGHSRFVLSASGHIAASVNPPGHPRASSRVTENPPEDPQEFIASVQATKGSWRDDFVQWLTAHSGPELPAPRLPGSASHKVLAAAPGTYVFAK